MIMAELGSEVSHAHVLVDGKALLTPSHDQQGSHQAQLQLQTGRRHFIHLLY